MKRTNTIINAIALSLLIICLIFPSVSAVTAYVYIPANSSGTLQSTMKDLNGQALSGYVSSRPASTSYSPLVGRLYTRGSVFTIERASGSVYAGGTRALAWSNPNSESGGFYVYLSSPGSHYGTCSVSTQ